MKKFLKANEKALYLILAVFILLLLNVSGDDTLDYGLSGSQNAEKNITVYSPSFTLDKGEYDITLRANGALPKTVTVSSYTQNLITSFEMKSSEQTFKLELSEKAHGIAFSTEGSENVLTRAVVKSDSLLYTDAIYISLIIVFFLIFALWLKHKEESAEKAGIFIVICAAILSSYPLFTSYLYFGHDINFHLWRIEGIAEGLCDGQFPVRVHPPHNNGYGYITASVYPELFLYFPALLRLLGVSLPTAYKLMLFAMNILTALIMYYSAKGITKSRFAATIAAVIYTLSVWRLYGLYPRAALGEAFAMTFLPLVVLGLYHVIKGDKSKWYILAIAYTCIFQVHVITTVLCAMLSVVIALVFIKDCFSEKRWVGILKAIGVTVLLNLWYLVPFMKYYLSLDLAIKNVPPNTEFFSNAIIPAELFNVFNSSFGYSLLLPSGIKGNMSLSLGFTVSVCLVFAVGYFVFNKKDKLKDEGFTKAYFICGIMFLFAATSLFPWELLQKHPLINKFAGLVRMPWRFLSIATPLFVLCASHITSGIKLSDRAKKATLLVVCAASALFMVHFGTPFTTESATTLKNGQTPALYGQIGLDKEYLIKGTDASKLVAETYKTSDGVIKNYHIKNGTKVVVNIENKSDNGYVEVPLLYYPGYSARDEEGNKLETVMGDNNVLRVNVEDSSGNITVKYKGFFYFRIAEIISLLTLLWLIFGKKIKKELKKRGK